MAGLTDGRRKNKVDDVCDYFGDLPADARDGLLLTLGQIHRRELRREQRGEPAAQEQLPIEEAKS